MLNLELICSDFMRSNLRTLGPLEAVPPNPPL